MAEEILYWIGKGTVMIDSEPWDKNSPLPLGRLTKEFIEKHKKEGNIGQKVVSRDQFITGEMSALAKENEELTKKVKDLEKTVNDLQAENEKLKKDLEKAEKKGGK
jgi:peptidoglycan hydrolase CwlO-like protein